MRHLTEEELVEHYYGESSPELGAALHLEVCNKCSAAYETLRKDLHEIELGPVPETGAEFGDHIWEKIRHTLPAYEKKPRLRWALNWNWKPFAYALTCSTLVVAAFLLGRHWEHRQPGNNVIVQNNQAAKERVVLLVVGDHLERSERLLVELNHADGATPAMAGPLQEEARKLLSDNRLYLQTSGISNDPMLSGALDRLQRVLLEVANEPEGLSRTDIERLQKDMNTKGLLFEIRVLKSKTAQPNTTDAESGRKGLAI